MTKKSVLNNKRILVVDDEPDVLELVKQEILAEAPNCVVDTAQSYERALELLLSWSYDLAIFDIMGVHGHDLLRVAVTLECPIPTVMLTGKVFSPENLRKSIDLGARAFLPKWHLGALVPFLEDVLTYEYGPAWRLAFKQLEGLFNEMWGPYWRKPDETFWKKFEEKISVKEKNSF